jgi:tRNA pseudouridine38-40 synthase
MGNAGRRYFQRAFFRHRPPVQVRPAHLRTLCGWSWRPLDVPAMQAAASLLLGAHDFSAFRSSQCQAKSPVRTLHDACIERRGALVIATFGANAFLHHMVRNIMGALVQVGQGKWPPARVAALLQSRERSQGARTFEAQGLYLTGVRYPDAFGLPQDAAEPPWWQLAEARQ